MVQLELFPELSIPEHATEAPSFIEVLATCHAALNVVGERYAEAYKAAYQRLSAAA